MNLGADMYDPATNAWTPAAPLMAPRATHAAVTLADGRVLVTGGGNATAEIYDPASDGWSAAAPMNDQPPYGCPMLPLPNGKILVPTPSGIETYDPASDTWALEGPAPPGGWSCNYARLKSGKLMLITGAVQQHTVAVQIYDPATETWSPAAPQLIPRSSPDIVPLEDGRAIVAGGKGYQQGSYFHPLEAELYDPATDTWTFTTPLRIGREGATMVELTNGEALLVGGEDYFPWNHDVYVLASAERYRAHAAPPAPQGAHCASASDCASDVCTDGFCCNAPCPGPCFTCSEDKGAYGKGICTPISDQCN